MASKIKPRDIEAGRFYRRAKNGFVRYVISVDDGDAHYADRYGGGRCTLASLASWADAIVHEPPEAEAIFGVLSGWRMASERDRNAGTEAYWCLGDRDRRTLAEGSVREIESVRTRMVRIYGEVPDEATDRYHDALRLCHDLDGVSVAGLRRQVEAHAKPGFHALTFRCRETARRFELSLHAEVEFVLKPARVDIAVLTLPWPAGMVPTKGPREQALELIVDALVAAGWRTFRERMGGAFDVVWQGGPSSPLPRA